MVQTFGELQLHASAREEKPDLPLPKDAANPRWLPMEKPGQFLRIQQFRGMPAFIDPQNGVAYQQIAAEVLEVMTEVKRTFIQKLRGISPPEGSTFGLIHPETKKVERIIAKVVAHFRGMLLWRTDGEPLDEDVVQSVIPGHDKQILRFLDATISIIESDSPIKQ